MSRVFGHVYITQYEANLRLSNDERMSDFLAGVLFLYIGFLSNFWKYIHVDGKIILIRLFTLMLLGGFLMSETNELLDIAIN